MENEKITLISMNKFSWNQVFSNFFIKTLFSQLLAKKYIRVNFRNFHTMVQCAQCGKLQTFTATVYSQKFRQINVLLKNFTISWFDGKKIAWLAVNFSFFHTVTYCMWRLHIGTLSQFYYHSQKFSVKLFSMFRLNYFSKIDVLGA